jgi:hypothetical protein
MVRAKSAIYHSCVAPVTRRLTGAVPQVPAGLCGAAGAILAMLADTMIPEAFEVAGLITVAGFLAAFALSKPWR